MKIEFIKTKNGSFYEATSEEGFELKYKHIDNDSEQLVGCTRISFSSDIQKSDIENIIEEVEIKKEDNLDI